MKKIIVTGSNGYIGSVLCRLLTDQQYEVIGIDTNYFDQDCAYLIQEKPYRTIHRDVRDISQNDLDGAYAICHLAALSNDPVGELNERLTLDINHRASVRLAKIAKSCGVRKFILSSSCSLYGISDGDNPLNESAAMNPITAYAKSKVHAEGDILPLSDGAFCVTSLRNATAYGISPKLRLDLVVNNLIGWAVVSGEVRIMSDGSPWRPLIHVEDIARAFMAVLEAPEERVNQQTFNTGINEENYQVSEIARLINSVVPDSQVRITGEHGSDSRSYRVDFSKIQRMLPEFRPAWRLQDGIHQILNSYHEHGMDNQRMLARYFIRIQQLKYLMENQQINSDLYWLM